jgi:hypothetical protein
MLGIGPAEENPDHNFERVLPKVRQVEVLGKGIATRPVFAYAEFLKV